MLSSPPTSLSLSKTLLLLLFLSAIWICIGTRSLSFVQGTDFPHLYCAARIVAQGRGSQLYDADLQRQYQARDAGRVGNLYTHPPFETLFYLGVAWLPLKRAYLLYCLLNLAFLAASARLLARELPFPWHWPMLLVAALTFVPVLLCLAQGQDSLLHLLLVILVFISLRRQRAFAAGCWLGLGLFKFQLTLPLFLVLILSLPRNSRTGLVRGFSLTALALAGLSVAACGWSVFTGYGKFLLHYPQQPSGNIFPQVMANLRGLTGFFCAGPRSPGCIAVLSVLSAAALVKTLLAWQHAEYGNDAPLASRQAQFDLAFSSTVLFALLVSYHLYPHDLSLLLLPISLLLWHARARTALLHTQPRSLTVGLSALLFLPPPHLFALLAGGYALLAIPLFLLLFVIAPSGPLTPPATTLEKATLRRDSR